MIDKKHQGKGYGRRAMLALMKRVVKEYDVSTIYLSLTEHNEVARKLYESIGFVYMNEKDPSNDELMFHYIVK